MKTLMVRAEDVEEAVLIAVDTDFLASYGPQTGWQKWQWDQYSNALDTVRREFAGEES